MWRMGGDFRWDFSHTAEMATGILLLVVLLAVFIA